MPFWEIHLLRLPWQGKGGWVGDVWLGFVCRLRFWGVGEGDEHYLIWTTDLLRSLGSMFLQVCGLGFFIFLLCPWLVSKRFISAEINYYTCKCWSKHQEMPWPWRLPEHWKEALNTAHKMCRGKVDRSREYSDRYWRILIPAEHRYEKKSTSTNWKGLNPNLRNSSFYWLFHHFSAGLFSAC